MVVGLLLGNLVNNIFMKKQLDQIKEFHDAYSMYDEPKKPEFDIQENLKELRIRLIEEESKEVANAIRNEDIQQVAKELADLLYVTYGTIRAFGLQDKMEKVFDEVHRSNMSKLDDDGKPIRREDGKVLKSKNYSPADLSDIL